MGAVPRWTESVNGITLADVKHIVVLCLFVAVAAMVLALSADGPGVASAASSSSVPSTCSADHLSTTGSWEGATNSNLGAVSFTDTGTKACSLKGYLPLTLRTQSGKTLPVAIRHAGITLLPKPVRHPRAVVLAPGVPHAADVLFQWWNWCGPNPGQLSVHVALTARQSLTVVPQNGGFPAVPPGCIEGPRTPSWLGLAPVGPR